MCPILISEYGSSPTLNFFLEVIARLYYKVAKVGKNIIIYQKRITLNENELSKNCKEWGALVNLKFFLVSNSKQLFA